MEIISGVVFSIGLLILFCLGYFFGYRSGMQTMKRIDDRIIEEAKGAFTERSGKKDNNVTNAAITINQITKQKGETPSLYI